MDVREKKQKEVEEVVDVLCDRCGGSCWDKEDMNLEFAEMKVMWGYASSKDLERHKIQLCESCYDETIKIMGIKPQISHYM